MSLPTACYFLLAQKVTKKGTLPNASSRKANAPLAGQRGSRAFFYRLVLRTVPYKLIMSILQIYKPIVRVILGEIRNCRKFMREAGVTCGYIRASFQSRKHSGLKAG